MESVDGSMGFKAQRAVIIQKFEAVHEPVPVQDAHVGGYMLIVATVVIVNMESLDAAIAWNESCLKETVAS